LTLLQEQEQENDIQKLQLLTLLQETIESTWSGGVQAPVQMIHTNNNNNASSSSLLQVMMVDVSGGAVSPSMANQVLAWRQEQEQQYSANVVPHWDNLVQINQSCAV
jgi:hypothetical protein